MRKIRDFIYNFSDIFTTLLILAIAGGIIFWRVQVIMGYSDLVAKEKNETTIDIDFSDVDLTPIEKPDFSEGDPQIPEENQTGEQQEPAITIDENFVSPKQVAVAIPAGSGYSQAIRFVAEAYGFSDDDYFVFYQLLWDKGIALGADTYIQIGTFTIPAGTSLEGIIRIISSI